MKVRTYHPDNITDRNFVDLEKRVNKADIESFRYWFYSRDPGNYDRLWVLENLLEMLANGGPFVDEPA